MVTLCCSRCCSRAAKSNEEHGNQQVAYADWKASLAGLPIEVDITDSRGTVVSRNALKLSATAFEEIAFVSQLAAPTGTYEASSSASGPE